ncbi:putative nucleoredoxin 1-2 [Apium graveolens]|uniref:putative nucleoredoxin 1-2 n=1 Tax=Apium graveolens TaxID=4045 RepID=UPI003D7B9319
MTFCTSLMHIYKDLQPNNNFEVVFIPFNDSCGSEILYYEDLVSRMPWTTIPLSDITCKHLKRRFGLPDRLYLGNPIIVDPAGMILQYSASLSLLDFGALGYPFCDQRLDFLKSEDVAASRQPSLHMLLASSKRDYLISNNGDQVPIHTLENKVVALYFYEEGFSDEKITEELQMAYKELARNNKKFEVVLVYRFDGLRTWGYKSDESFWKTFKTMPWLNFKIAAYPFSRDRVAELITEEAKELRLEMLWEPNSVFGGKFGSEVLFSQLAGKRVIIIFDWGYLADHDVKFLETLKERYVYMKGTNDEFEVIHITRLCSKTEHVANLPWFVLPLSQDYDAWFVLPLSQDYDACVSILFDLTLFPYHGCTSLIAFDQDGRVVRTTIVPTFEDIDFPFYAGDLEEEAVSQLGDVFEWDLSSFTGSIYSYKQEQKQYSVCLGNRKMPVRPKDHCTV